jgi:hypothetical protein
MSDSLADLIPKEDFSAGEKWHSALEAIEAIDVVFAIGEGTGAAGLVAVALNIGGEKLAEGLLVVGELAEGFLAVAAPLAALAAEFIALGLGYEAALETISEEHATQGFALGVVLAVEGRQPKEILKDSGLWTPYIPHNDFIDAADGLALRSYQMGVIAGMKYGRELNQTQRKNFWTDLIARDQKDQFVDWENHDDPDKYDWSASVVFRKYHLSGESGEASDAAQT